MTKLNGKHHLLLLGKRGAILLLATILGFATLFYSLNSQMASAAQLASRSVTISTSQSGAASDYAFEFSWSDTVAVQSAIFQFCTTPLGTCTLPTGMDATSAVSVSGQANFPANGTAFTINTTGGGTCDDTGNTGAETMVCLTRSASTTGTGTNAAITLNDVGNATFTNPDTFVTVFVRVTLYSDTAWATQVQYGTVAAAMVNQLTTTGRVQERLEFCVAAIADAVAMPDNCSGFPTTTNIDLGIIDNNSIAAAPVANTTTNPANNSYGVLNIDTNASNGVAVTYFPEAATNVNGGDTDQLRNFRVLPTDCSATEATFTDQCFRSAGTTGQVFAINQEWFGMAVACFNVTDTTKPGNVGYTTSFYPSTSGTVFNGAYWGDYDGVDSTLVQETTPGTTNDCQTRTATGYTWGWDNGGTPDDIVTTNTVVDNEIIKLRFGAVAAATTPTGTYSVTTTYIATPTY